MKRMIYKKSILLTFLMAFMLSFTYAQDDSGVIKSILDDEGSPKLIVLDTKSPTNQRSAGDAESLFARYLKTTSADELKFANAMVDNSGFEHMKYQQFYNGVKVEYGNYSIHAKNGFVQSMSGEFKKLKDLSINPGITKESAFQSAISSVGASEYLWENSEESKIMKYTKPEGELVIVNNTLAYKFDVYATEPLSRTYIYVDAKSGEIVHTNDIIHHANATGSAATRYSGTKSIGTETTSGGYRLRDYTRGSGIETFDMNTSTSYGNAVDFVDANNSWTEWNNAQKDNGALDAHWGAMMTYDYWISQHGRNSWNGNGAKIQSYVHYSSNYDNAFWNGSVMTYGDGNNFDILTSLDVAAHEIGHAVCTSTANLVYRNESGAMNEGFSDIWAACVESFAAPEKQIWQVGEDIDQANGTGLRSMSNPNSKGDPDTYQGSFWNFGSSDNGGVHTNSGVLNHWFYILTEGKSGSNDNGDSYSVTGIGIIKAGQIAYRLESVYLSSNSQYIDGRNFGIQAAEDLFGVGSPEAIATQNAWYAVGIGAEFGGGGGGETFSCASTISSFPYSEGFESGNGAWSQGSGDDFNWTRNTGGTPSSNTGPASASSGSYYMFVESSSPNYPSKVTNYESPCFDLSGLATANFTFDYHMYGAAGMGGLELQASTATSTWSTIWSLSGNQGNSWQSASVSLGSYLGSTVKLRFVGTTGSTWQGDMAVDNVGVSTGTGGGGGTTATLLESFFETGWDGWADGGGDSFRYTGANSYEGSYSIRLRDNSGVASAMTSGGYDVNSYDQIDVEFFFYANSMETGEDFWLRFYNGSAWQTVGTWVSGTDFDNNTFYTTTVSINASQYNFSNNAQFRFQCDASANADQVYIDAVTITASSNSSLIAGRSGIVKIEALGGTTSFAGLGDQIDALEYDLQLFPNPATDILNIQSIDDIVKVKVYSITGTLMTDTEFNEAGVMDVSKLKSGVYLLQVQTTQELMTRKFIKQ